jgi:16S rRNA (uracil1498-N3)-methyltransferase
MRVLLGADRIVVGQVAALLEGEEHHLRVRRARDGDAVELRDGSGLVGSGRLTNERDTWRVVVEALERMPAPATLLLAVGAGDRERFGVVVEKAVELGVTAVVPLETERTRSVSSRVRPAHLDRLRRQALEAVKQSGNPWACSVEAPVTLVEYLERPTEGERWLADAKGDTPPAVLHAQSCAILVGPEGGFTHQERQNALAAGYRPLTLAPHILRLETAAIAAAALVQTARRRGRHG